MTQSGFRDSLDIEPYQFIYKFKPGARKRYRLPLRQARIVFRKIADEFGPLYDGTHYLLNGKIFIYNEVFSSRVYPHSKPENNTLAWLEPPYLQNTVFPKVPFYFNNLQPHHLRHFNQERPGDYVAKYEIQETGSLIPSHRWKAVIRELIPANSAVLPRVIELPMKKLGKNPVVKPVSPEENKRKKKKNKKASKSKKSAIQPQVNEPNVWNVPLAVHRNENELSNRDERMSFYLKNNDKEEQKGEPESKYIPSPVSVHGPGAVNISNAHDRCEELKKKEHAMASATDATIRLILKEYNPHMSSEEIDNLLPQWREKHRKLTEVYLGVCAF